MNFWLWTEANPYEDENIFDCHWGIFICSIYEADNGLLYGEVDKVIYCTDSTITIGQKIKSL